MKKMHYIFSMNFYNITAALFASTIAAIVCAINSLLTIAVLTFRKVLVIACAKVLDSFVVAKLTGKLPLSRRSLK
jgi:hypothetical protein